MVMTNRQKPGHSFTGVVLAIVLAGAGCAAVPAFSHPPEKAIAPTELAFKTRPSAPVFAVAPSPKAFVSLFPSKASAPIIAVAPDGMTSYVRVAPAPTMLPFVTAPHLFAGNALGAVVGDDDEMRKQLKELEKQLRELSRQLNRGDRQQREPRKPRAPREPRAPFDLFGRSDNGENIIRMYHLPKGKLQALTNLMIRSDVPVLVSPKEDGIEVHGSKKQHKIFSDFVQMIHPSDGKRSRGRVSVGRARIAERAASHRAAIDSLTAWTNDSANGAFWRVMSEHPAREIVADAREALESAMVAVQAIPDDLRPIISDAMLRAAAEVRSVNTDAIREAMETASRAIRDDCTPRLLADLLEKVEALSEVQIEGLAETLEQVAEQMESVAPDLEGLLERIAEAIEKHADSGKTKRTHSKTR